MIGHRWEKSLIWFAFVESVLSWGMLASTTSVFTWLKHQRLMFLSFEYAPSTGNIFSKAFSQRLSHHRAIGEGNNSLSFQIRGQILVVLTHTWLALVIRPAEWLGACLAFHDEQTLAEEKLQLLDKMDRSFISFQCHIESTNLFQNSSISAIQGACPLRKMCWGRSSLFLCPHSALQRKYHWQSHSSAPSLWVFHYLVLSRDQYFWSISY